MSQTIQYISKSLLLHLSTHSLYLLDAGGGGGGSKNPVPFPEGGVTFFFEFVGNPPILTFRVWPGLSEKSRVGACGEGAAEDEEEEEGFDIGAGFWRLVVVGRGLFSSIEW